MECTMKNPVCYFEIPVTDLDRAIAFYNAVFDYQFDRVTIDGNEMALFPASDKASGITGALAKGDSYVPGKQGSRIYFSVVSIKETLQKVKQAGGEVLYQETSVGAYGSVAELEDSEGNCIALHSVK